MIKIIEPGKLVYDVRCAKCGCFFSFSAEDVILRTAWDDHGGHYPVADFYEIKCPYCTSTIVLNGIVNFKEEEKELMNHIND